MVANAEPSVEKRTRKAGGRLPMTKLVEIWSSLPGVAPITKFKDKNTEVSRTGSRSRTSNPRAQQGSLPSINRVPRNRRPCRNLLGVAPRCRLGSLKSESRFLFPKRPQPSCPKPSSRASRRSLPRAPTLRHRARTWRQRPLPRTSRKKTPTEPAGAKLRAKARRLRSSPC